MWRIELIMGYDDNARPGEVERKLHDVQWYCLGTSQAQFTNIDPANKWVMSSYTGWLDKMEHPLKAPHSALTVCIINPSVLK